LLAGAMGDEPNGNVVPVHGDAVTTPPSGSRPPLDGEIGDLQQHFPQLEILELLGRGGMGAVYKVRQKNLDRLVAIKVIPPTAAKDPAFAERFAREARAMARLNHPSIVTVYDYGETNGVFWLLMEYIDGINLRQTLQAGRLTPAEALSIVPPICDALQYAHDQGVVHRDIKPENVLLDRSGRVKIADFGLAKLLGKGPDDFTLTHTQQVMGTPRYMAPEQIEKPTSVDHRADIYSLGVVIYEMLTGELPLGRFAPPSERAALDVRIDQVVLRALEKEPDRRYQRASQVKTELASASSWPAASAPPSPLAGEGPAVRGAQPSWHTPAYATKSDGLTPRADVPLGMLLAVAFGMVLGVLMMGGGVAILAYGLWFSFRALGDGNAGGIAWGYFGAAFGCIVGGFGSAAGSYNSYRQLAGAEDLMRSPRTTWFDWVMRGYLLVGIGLLAAGFYFIDPVYTEQTGKALLTLGGVATLQAGLFLLLRLMMRGPAASQPTPAVASDPRTESIRRRVAGPAIGLMIVGLLGFSPLCVVLFALTVLVPVSTDRIDRPAPAPVYEKTLEAKQSFQPLIAPGTIAWAFPAARLPLLVAQVPDSIRMMPAAALLLIVIALPLNLILSLTLIAGGWRMRQLKSYGLAMIATVLAMLPCTMGWFLGLPIGLWSLLTLMQPEVREAFES
jgi:predicted Ser/Thr protein kinase